MKKRFGSILSMVKWLLIIRNSQCNKCGIYSLTFNDFRFGNNFDFVLLYQLDFDHDDDLLNILLIKIKLFN